MSSITRNTENKNKCSGPEVVFFCRRVMFKSAQIAYERAFGIAVFQRSFVMGENIRQTY